MKTFKIIFVIFAALIAAGFSQVNAQAYQDKNVQWYGPLWVGCANNGEGETFWGTLYAHGVFHTSKNGELFAHWNYDKSSTFIGEKTGEVVRVTGVTNLKFNKLVDIGDYSLEWNEMLIFKGDKGTKILVKTKWHDIYYPEDGSGEWVMELFFEKCLD